MANGFLKDYLQELFRELMNEHPFEPDLLDQKADEWEKDIDNWWKNSTEKMKRMKKFIIA